MADATDFADDPDFLEWCEEEGWDPDSDAYARYQNHLDMEAYLEDQAAERDAEALADERRMAAEHRSMMEGTW